MSVIEEQQYFHLRKISPDYYSSYSLPAYLTKVLPENKSAKILDIGCGFGQTLRALSGMGYTNIHGVDISDEAVQHCRDSGLKVEMVTDLASYMEENRQAYDFILMSHVLEHIEKTLIIPYVKAIKFMLKENGLFMVMVPNAQSNTDCYWAYEDFTHSTLFTTGSLYFVLLAGGFKEVEFVDPYCVEGVPFFKRKVKMFLLQLFTINKHFWNKVTTSSYHRPSPILFSYEIKALAK
jgi:2-polyprenyl-3-methyl-5-hydroxy-6-metoxy-1,4-benzoquinol methylase